MPRESMFSQGTLEFPARVLPKPESSPKTGLDNRNFLLL